MKLRRRLYNERIAILSWLEKKDLGKDGDDSCDDTSRDLLYIIYYHLAHYDGVLWNYGCMGVYDEEEKEKACDFGCMDQRMTVGIPGWWCSI